MRDEKDLLLKMWSNRRIIQRGDLALMRDAEAFISQRLWDQLQELWKATGAMKWSQIEVMMRVELDE